MNGVMDAIDVAGPNAWETMVLGFADAFKQLPVAPDERRDLRGKALGGYFVYRVVCFGMKRGPLLLGDAWLLLSGA